MANINKKKAVAQAAGLPTKEQILTSPSNRDTLSTTIKGADGSETPAALTEGEFVFAVPAIIALGQGEYDKGAEMLTQIHDELLAAGKEMVGQGQEQGLAAVPQG